MTAWYHIRTDHMDADAYADLRSALHDPATIHAMCEDYRPGLGLDRDDDDADRAHGRRLGCLLLFGWATRDDLGQPDKYRACWPTYHSRPMAASRSVLAGWFECQAG